MRSTKAWRVMGLLLGLSALWLLNCELDQTPSVWNPADVGSAAPQILQVDPAQSAFAGYSQVKITGEHFAPDTAQNYVYFGSHRARVLTASATEITVLPPAILGDSLMIKVVVPGALTAAQYGPYQLEYVTTEYGSFGAADQIQSMTVDAQENVYAQMPGNKIVKITPQGEVSDFGTISFPRAADMKAGPGGYIYMQQNLSAKMFRMPLSGGAAVLFATLPKTVVVMDFDANQNIFCAGNKSGVFMVKPDASISDKGTLADFDVKSLRIVQGSLYVLANYMGKDTAVPKAGIWRCTMDANGDLGAPVLVFDWAASGSYAGARFFVFDFAADGDIYIASNATDPILVVHPGGSSEPLYAGMLIKYYHQMEWGNGVYLYANRSTQSGTPRLQRINLTKLGAGYNGRK